MKYSLQDLAGDIRTAADIVENPDTVCSLDYAVSLLRSVTVKLEGVRMVDLDRREVRVK